MDTLRVQKELCDMICYIEQQQFCVKHSYQFKMLYLNNLVMNKYICIIIVHFNSELLQNT